MFTHFLLISFITSYYSNVVSFEKRIIGGEPARAGQFPFSAGIFVTTANSRFFCGGTLVNDQWLVTAGQCVYNAELFTIQLGSNHLTSDDPNRVILATSTYILHPDFNPETLENDIGLIQLRLPIEFTDYIQPIYNLPFHEMEADWTLWATGWGQTRDDDGELSDELNVANVVVLSNDECKITFGNQIKENMLCAVGAYNEGICIGDTGSALVEPTRPVGNGILGGIASFISGNGCESTDPSGYTRTYPYNSWIRNVTGA